MITTKYDHETHEYGSTNLVSEHWFYLFLRIYLGVVKDKLCYKVCLLDE